MQKKKSEFSGKKIAVLGFGIEGEASAVFLLQEGALVSVFDEKEAKNFDGKKIKTLESKGVKFFFGAFQSFEAFDVIIRSPGIRPYIKSLQDLFDLGVEITSATEIFLKRSPAVCIGVTGTKGKGTTSSLLYEILKKTDKDVYLAGNIGVPALNLLPELTSQSLVVLELSSFQLIDLKQSPHIAVVLMVTEDHRDYHQAEGEYQRAKATIAKYQKTDDFVIVNAEYPRSVAIAEQSPGTIVSVSRHKKMSEGCFVDNGTIVTIYKGLREEILSTDTIPLQGAHNRENICAAVMAAKILEVPNEIIASVVKEFKGLRHRLELVREVQGIRWYNDSISTTPESAIAAIKAFTNPEILILGGSSKGADFTELGTALARALNLKAIIGIGEEWPRIKSTIKKTNIKVIEGLRTMSEVVAKAAEVGKPGDVVILSPACASFGMFKDYKDRGDQFSAAVHKL